MHIHRYRVSLRSLLQRARRVTCDGWSGCSISINEVHMQFKEDTVKPSLLAREFNLKAYAGITWHKWSGQPGPWTQTCQSLQPCSAYHDDTNSATGAGFRYTLGGSSKFQVLSNFVKQFQSCMGLKFAFCHYFGQWLIQQESTLQAVMLNLVRDIT